MKQNNLVQKTSTSSTHTEKGTDIICIRESSGPRYGKISEGSGIFKLSYEGEDPMRNYVYASIISVIRYTLIAAASAAVPIIVGWGLKKLKLIANKDDKSYGDLSMSPDTSNISDTQNNAPICKSFKEDVEAAVRAGKPNNLLCDEIYESSRIIIFSGPGVGKSVMVDQMGFGIATGKPCGIFPNEINATPQQVLLIDTEQEDTDLYIRYANGLSEIPEKMNRVSNCNFNTVEEVTYYIKAVVESWKENGTVIIDNITSAFSLQSPERIRSFYNQLRAIQNQMKERGVIISYIILCHQTKSSKKLTLQALQGSGNIGNFATAVYGLEKIGEDLVKFKVLKNRRSKNNGRAYLEKFFEKPYFHFEFQQVVDGHSEDDKESLPAAAETPSNEQAGYTNGRKLSDAQIEEMCRLYRTGEMTINQLHLKFGVNNRTVRKYLGLKH